MVIEPGADVSEVDLTVGYGTWPQVMLVGSTPFECTQSKLHALFVGRKC